MNLSPSDLEFLEARWRVVVREELAAVGFGEDFLTKKEAAEFLRCSLDTVRQYTRDKRLTAYGNGRPRYSRVELAEAVRTGLVIRGTRRKQGA